MAIAIQSSSTVTGWATAASVVLTKPTGLAVGDLMVAVIGASGDTVDAKSGWTVSGGQVAGATYIRTFYRIADSADVAASDFTFTLNSSVPKAGVLLRIDGHSSSSPFDADLEGTASGLSAAPSISGTLTPAYTGSLLVMAWVGQYPTGGTSTTASSYSITGPSNPSWTEYLDTSVASGNDPIIAVAAAVLDSTTAITAFTLTWAANRDNHAGMLSIYTAQFDVTVSAGVISLAGSPKAPAITGDANVTAGLASLTATPQAVTASSPTPKWSNKAKSSAPSYTNKAKS